jgi:hypothetical protein
MAMAAKVILMMTVMMTLIMTLMRLILISIIERPGPDRASHHQHATTSPLPTAYNWQIIEEKN